MENGEDPFADIWISNWERQCEIELENEPDLEGQVQSERDLTNIDELFTKEAVLLTPDSPTTIARIQQNEFEGFEYINPLILSDELQV